MPFSPHWSIVLLASLPIPPVAAAQSSAPDTSLAMARPETAASGKLIVSSPSFRTGSALPPRFSAYNEGVSPEIRWSGAPSTTKSLVLLMEDPDAKRLKPVIHWVAYDIPADASGLPMGLPTDPELDAPVKGMLQGKNSHDATGYFGPRPPAGDPPHHYHFQVFALDAKLGLEPGADREQVLKAMKGHVVARGEVVATFSKPK